MDWYTVCWLLWLAWFGIEEGKALVDHVHTGGTLSEHVWSWFAIRSTATDGWTRARRFILIAFLTWLSVHFVSGGWA